LPIRPLLLPTIEERAKNLFVSRHVVGTPSTIPIFDYMQKYYSGNPSYTHLGITIRAVSLAYLANELFAPEILQIARRRYSSALLLTNKALGCARTAVQNTTLLTVLLLHLFEKLANKNHPSINCKHIEGAIVLVKLRGCEQFQDDVGLRMFHQLTSNVLTSCLEREVEVPIDLLTLRSYASQYVDTNDLRWRFSELMIRFITLRVAMTRGEISFIAATRAAAELDIENTESSMVIRQNWKFSDIISGAIPTATLSASLVEAGIDLTAGTRGRRLVQEIDD
jgi:hypothetical protein